MDNATQFSKLIEELNLNDYEIARRCGVGRSTIRSLRIGQNIEPGYTLGIKLAALSGIPIPGSLRELEKAAPPCG